MSLLSQPGGASQVWRDRTLSDLQDDVFVATVPEYASVLYLSELITAKTSQDPLMMQHCIKRQAVWKDSRHRWLPLHLMKEVTKHFCPFDESYAIFVS